jgi:hypothetical protein
VGEGEIYEAVVNTFTASPTQPQQPTLHVRTVVLGS